MKKVHFINNLPKNKENNECHLLPCSISFSGLTTDANEYFYKKIIQNKEKKDEYRNSYLGREIFAKKTAMSAGKFRYFLSFIVFVVLIQFLFFIAIYERGGESEMNVKYYQMQKFDDIMYY